MSAAPKHPIAPDARGAHSLHRRVVRTPRFGLLICTSTLCLLIQQMKPDVVRDGGCF